MHQSTVFGTITSTFFVVLADFIHFPAQYSGADGLKIYFHEMSTPLITSKTRHNNWSPRHHKIKIYYYPYSYNQESYHWPSYFI